MEPVQPRNLEDDPKTSHCTQPDVLPSVATFTLRKTIRLCCLMSNGKEETMFFGSHQGTYSKDCFTPQRASAPKSNINFKYTKLNNRLFRNSEALNPSCVWRVCHLPYIESLLCHLPGCERLCISISRCAITDDLLLLSPRVSHFKEDHFVSLFRMAFVSSFE